METDGQQSLDRIRVTFTAAAARPAGVPAGVGT